MYDIVWRRQWSDVHTYNTYVGHFERGFYERTSLMTKLVLVSNLIREKYGASIENVGYILRCHAKGGTELTVGENPFSLSVNCLRHATEPNSCTIFSYLSPESASCAHKTISTQWFCLKPGLGSSQPLTWKFWQHKPNRYPWAMQLSNGAIIRLLVSMYDTITALSANDLL